MEIIKHGEVKQKFELNESLLKKLITEELGISKAIADKTEEVYAMLEDDISSNNQNKRKGNWWSVQEGSFSFKLMGVKVYVSYTCTDYNSDDSDAANVFGTQQEASSVMTDSGSAFMFLNITSVNGKINSESAKDGIQHELEHIYQQTMSGGRFNDSEAYSEIVTMMRFGDEFERKVGRLLYGCVRSEQDGFVNGMYAYMMSIPGPFKLEVMKDTECAKLYDEMVSIYNEIGNTEEFSETIRKFGYTTKKIDKKITAFAKKIARVISKVQKDKMSKQGLRF